MLHITSHIIIIQLHIAFHINFMFHAFYKHSKNFISSYVISAYSKEVNTGKNCMYPKVLSLYETVIYKLYCIVLPKRGHCNDPNRIHVIDPNGATLSVNCILQHCYPYRHAYLSNNPIISRQSVLLCFLNNFSGIRKRYLIYMNNY